jgi:4-hydroxymandelate oxidase
MSLEPADRPGSRTDGLALLNLHDYEEAARGRLPQMVFDYFAGGANDELTLHENLAAWGRIRFRPRSLVDVGTVTTAVTVLGHHLSAPILTAPCSFNRMAHPDGEIGVARATRDAGLIQVVSMQATATIEEIAAVEDGQRWLQLAVLRDRGITRALVERAEAAGYGAICVTVDVPVLGRRERDSRNGFRLPDGISMVNLDPYTPVAMGATDDVSALARFVGELWDPTLTWDAMDWLCSITRLPVVAKGVLTAEDGRHAVDHGVRGVIVSNHGGRQLDGAVSTCAALPDVVAAVGEHVDVLVDGGIRRGADIVRALALGAKAVLIGRPYLWALAVDGEAGVGAAVAMLRAELELAMGLLGRPSIQDLDRTVLA